MKSVSLILRIVALLAAAACVYFWFDTKGIVNQAKSNMKDVDGVGLLDKSAKVPGILSDKEKLNTELSSAKTKIANLENKEKEIASNLDSERTRNVKTNQDLVKVQTELRQTKIKLDDSAKKVGDLDKMIAALKKEIETGRVDVDDAAKIEALNAKYNTLNNNFATLQAQYDEAKKKADLLDIAIIVEEKEIDMEKGVERTTKKIYPPYVGEGDVATITIVEGREDLIALNRGKNSGLAELQVIDLKDKTGDLIAKVSVVEIGPDFAIASVNPKIGKPETLENGDMLELVKTVELKAPEAASTTDEAPAPADAAEEADDDE